MNEKINNFPEEARDYKYLIVRRANDGSLWFYGAFDEIGNQADGICNAFWIINPEYSAQIPD